MALMSDSWPVKVCRHIPSRTSQSLAEASQAPETNSLVSGASERLMTSPVCPVNVVVCWPVSMSHRALGESNDRGYPLAWKTRYTNKLPRTPRPAASIHASPKTDPHPVVTLLKWVVTEPSTHTTWISPSGASLILTPAHTSAEEGAESLSSGDTCGLGCTLGPHKDS